MSNKFFASRATTGSFYPVSIPYSCRFDSVRSCKASRTPGGAGDKKKWSLSFWAKWTGAYSCVFSAGTGLQEDQVIFSSTGFGLQSYEGSTSTAYDSEFALNLRDYSAWAHYMVVWDSAQATAANRLKFYMNGVQLMGGTINHPQNYELSINATELHQIGDQVDGTYHGYANAYLSDFYLIDGSALTPSSFGQFSTANPNVWVPKTPTGLTYGTNGFHLDFSNASALGTDTSGNGNNYTSSGLTTADQFADTPTNNWCTLNPLGVIQAGGSVAPVFSEGNTKVAWNDAGSYGQCVGTMALPSTGKFYWEGKLLSGVRGSVGLRGESGKNCMVYGTFISVSSPGTGQSGFTALAVNDIVGCCYDADAKTLQIKVNNVNRGTAIDMSPFGSELFFPFVGDQDNGTANATQINFGSNAFTYTPPTGFKALCSANLPDPNIIDSSKYFDAKLYTGTGSSQNITSFNLQPDLVWIKDRTDALNHKLVDSTRGVTKSLESNTTASEATETTGLTALLSTGFTVGADADYNTNASNFVSWCWKKGTTSGFDIVSYTGTGAVARTVSHSLGAVPEMIILKNLTSAVGWPVYHKNSNASPATGSVYLNTSAAFAADSTLFNNTAPTSSVFTVGPTSWLNANGENFIAYLFRSIPGFSMIGSYTGNGSADGPFVYCGFRPRWLLVKCVTAVGGWYLYDTARGTYNGTNPRLQPNTSLAESAALSDFDILSNGFKCKFSTSGGGELNTSGAVHVFAAFAEAPFKYSNSR